MKASIIANLHADYSRTLFFIYFLNRGNLRALAYSSGDDGRCVAASSLVMEPAIPIWKALRKLADIRASGQVVGPSMTRAWIRLEL